MNPKAIFELLKETFSEWRDDNASRMAAALAYFTVLSLSPMLIIAIAVAGALVGGKAIRGEIVGDIQGVVGKDAANLIQSMIVNASIGGSGLAATVIALVPLLFGASGVFAQLQSALNAAWEVAPKPGRGIASTIQDRLLSFAMLLVIGFLLVVALGVSTALSAVNKFLVGIEPDLIYLSQVVNFVVSFGIVTLLFAMLYRFVPDAEIDWSDVWMGAAVTSLLFMIGTLVIGVYLGSRGIGSAYGAAGALVVILVWIYYSAQILFFGAEFTQVYARRHGMQIKPAEGAVRVTEIVEPGPAPAPTTSAERREPKRKEKPPAQPSAQPSETDGGKVRERLVAGLFSVSVGLLTFLAGSLIDKLRHRTTDESQAG